MAHHVAVGKVQDHHVVFAALDALDGLGGDLRLAHLGLEVVGGHLGGGDQAPVLPGEHGLHAAVEEEGHMGVLLRLGDAKLGHVLLGDIFAENVVQALLGEGNDHIGHGCVIGGGTHVVYLKEALFPLKAGKIGIHEGAGDLSGTVGAEVHEDDGVAFSDPGVLRRDHRHHELVRHPGVIAGLHRAHRVANETGLALAVYHGLVGPLDAVPVGVPVHGVVAAGDGGNLGPVLVAGLLHLGHEALAGGGGYVAAVHEAVDKNPGAAQLVGHLHRRLDVGDMAVHAAVGHQTVDVHRLTRLLGGQHGAFVGGVFKKIPVLNGLGDLRQVLEHHPARADIGVAHLAVAHLAVGKAHIQPGGGQTAGRVFGEDAVQIGGVCGIDGVVPHRGGGGQAKAVHDDQSGRCFHTKNTFLSKWSGQPSFSSG